MNTVTEPARAHNTRPLQAQWFQFPSRRVRFAHSIALAAAFLILPFDASAQKRREAILRLRDDVSTAMAHSTLNEKQTEKLDRCRQTLLLSAQSGRARKVTDKKDLDNALRDIEKAFHGGPFQPEDRDLVRKDIDQHATSSAISVHAVMRASALTSGNPTGVVGRASLPASRPPGRLDPLERGSAGCKACPTLHSLF